MNLKASNRNTRSIFTATGFILAGGIIVSLFAGATEGYDSDIFWMIRLPRTISAIGIGGGLAVAGTLVQASLGNPLADPYTIGIASAAALGAVVASLFKFNSLVGTGSFAFLFALGGLFILAAWLRKSFRQATEVLLAGVVSGFFFTSMATLLMALSDPAAWPTAIAWLMGSLGRLSLSESIATLFVMVMISGLAWMHWKPLDLVSVDEMSAESAGVDVGELRKRLFILSALITAICVSVSGVIGFLGLMIPHLLRRLGIRGHYLLIPASFVGGSGLLLCSDTVAKLIARPSEIPVGVIMAILGAPFFLFLARTRNPG